MKFNRFAKFAWIVLAFNLMVVLWGAYVRATGSGAGCGSHWPLCNGVVIPRAPQLETIIEFTHRLTSGLALLLVVIMLVWAWRVYPATHIVRKGAAWSLFFIITEALVGAGLVLFEWVAHDASLGRIISMAVHLINTFLLLGALVLTAWWASGGEAINLKGHGIQPWLFLIAFLLMLVLGVSGAITALGDTLFPSSSLAEGLRQDFSAEAHFLVRLRIWHPFIAILTGVYLLFLAGFIAMFRANPTIRRLAAVLAGLFVLQGIAGLINLALLAPVWMQLVHLFLADMVWLTLVLFSAANFSESELSINPG